LEPQPPVILRAYNRSVQVLIYFFFFCAYLFNNNNIIIIMIKGKAVPLQARSAPEGFRKLRFPDFMTTAQDGGRLSALATDHLYPQEMLLILISVKV